MDLNMDLALIDPDVRSEAVTGRGWSRAAMSTAYRAIPAAALSGPLVAQLQSAMGFGDLAAEGPYTIGEVSDHLHVSLRTLRFYEQSDMVHPRRDGTQRLYSCADVDRLRLIVALRALEASVAEIATLLGKLATFDDGRAGDDAIEGLLMAIYSSNHDRAAALAESNRRIQRLLVRRGD